MTGCIRSTGLPESLRPGVVAFVDAGDVSHEDFVNVAWTSDPLRDVLSSDGSVTTRWQPGSPPPAAKSRLVRARPQV